MSSRDTILKAIRETKPAFVPLPDITLAHMQYDDMAVKFSSSLASVGGNAVFAKDFAEVKAYIQEHYADDKVIVSQVEGLEVGTKESTSCTDPHTLRDVDLAIIKGEFAVAENGAVWVKEENCRHRALYFITQKLMIVVPKDHIVATMHEAYAHPSVAFVENGFGIFISGPSKTADIEQSLVIGAHGATEACVVFV